MRNYLIAAGILWGSFIFLIQCTKNQGNPVGSQFFQRDNPGSEKYTVFQAANSDTFYHTYVNTGNSSYLYLGQTGNDQAKSLILFSDLPDSGTIDSSIVTLYTNRILGAVESSLTASVHKVTGEWDESEVTWENFNNNLIGEEITSIEIPASENDSISFALPLSLINFWMDSSTSSENYGLYISSSNTSFLIEFFSRHTTLKPILRLYLDQDTTQTVQVINPSADVFIADTDKQPTSDRLFISNGTALRSLLFFDLSKIRVDATINRSLLLLYPDTLLSIPDNNETFNMLAYKLIDSLWSIPKVQYDSLVWISGSVNGDSASINITSIVQDWTSGEDKNFGLLLMGESEKNNISQRAFYSTMGDSIYRPKLEIFYSLPPTSIF